MQETDNSTEKSRSQKKRESSALQSQGEILARLSAAQLAELALPDELKAAVKHFQTLTKHEARRRQMQYLGRLMRELKPEELNCLTTRLANLNRKKNEDEAAFQQLEDLRTRLLDPDTQEETLTKVRQLYPQAQENKLRHLLQSPKAGKELFRYLRLLAEG
jgi:ribosome-associated protein